MASVWDDLDLTLETPCTVAAGTKEKGTIKDKANFNVHEDVAALRKAIEGLGTTESVLIEVLTGRSNAQRQLVCKSYKEATGRTLKADLEGDTRGNFEDILVALITPPDAFDCKEVIRATKGVGTKDSTLIEIFVSRTNKQIKALSEAYLAETGRPLTSDLQAEVSGDYGKALLILAEGKRDESTNADVQKARADAKALYEAGEKRWGTDEDKFIEVLCRQSFAQLRQTLVEYKNISKKSLQQSIESEMSGHLEELLVAIVKCVQSVPTYLAERLGKSMKGVGTKESMLNRIMVSRAEVDMLEIRAEFKKAFGYSLHSAIESDTSGDYGKTLLKICGGDDK